MIKFVKQEDGLLGAFDRNAKLDWDKLQTEITEMFGETRQTLAKYIPIEPVKDDDTQDIEQENIWGTEWGDGDDEHALYGDNDLDDDDDDSQCEDVLDNVGIVQTDVNKTTIWQIERVI